MTATEPLTDETFALTLPGSSYTDPAVFALERERIFERQWVYVGRADELGAPGSFSRMTVGNEDVVILKGRDEILRAFLNVCRHRGATLCTSESGDVGKAIRCPYHAWTYGLDGRLITAPNWTAMKDIDRQAYGLHAVALEVWNGLVWVNLSGDGTRLHDVQLRPQLEFRLGAELDLLDRYDVGSLVLGKRITYDVAANWKLIMENFQECYHCGTIHPELVETIPAFQAADTATDGYDTGGYSFAPGREAFSITGRRRLPRLPGLRPDDDLKYFGMVLRPNAFLSLAPDHVIVHRFEPLSPTQTRATCDWLFPEEVVTGEGYDVSEAVELFHRVNRQDFQAAEWCQPNMTSRGYRNGGVLAPAERLLISRWYDWYHASMEA